VTELVVHTTTAEETEDFGARLADGWPDEESLGQTDQRPAGLAPKDSAPDASRAGRRDIFGVIYLVGDLGAGKTTLTRGFLHRLGVSGAVRSPTYTLVEVYELTGARLPLKPPSTGTTPALSGMVRVAVHLDLYRLSDPDEFENLGLREYARGGCVWLVEWPERGLGRLPEPDLVVKLTGGEDGHDIEVEARTAFGSSWVERTAARLAS
jgi:tRNA threonylcarbamoyladenosine biosynthesis protein TsaE